MLDAHNLSYRFSSEGAPVLANVSLSLSPGEVVGLTGLSGSGKSTLGRLLCGHLPLRQGSVTIDGKTPTRDGFHPAQLLHQTPIFAMNPRWKIGRVLTEAWTPDEATCTALRIDPRWLDRYPHELSGGELQRVAIARVLAPDLRYLVADEITAMLDPITQAEIWAFLLATIARRGVGMLVISHDSALLHRVASRTISTAPLA
jgi:peptide/nickel transport system ATP-binding protein